jgi:hypothetical protein
MSPHRAAPGRRDISAGGSWGRGRAPPTSRSAPADPATSASRHRPGVTSHTAQSSPSSVTVHYSWHPLAGQTLSCKGQQPLPTGERAFLCLLPDGTWSLLPEWMTSRERCARCELVSEPHVSSEALNELVTFLRALRGRHQTIAAETTTPTDKGARPDETTRPETERAATGARVDGHASLGGAAGRPPRSARRRAESPAGARGDATGRPGRLERAR